MDENKKNIDVKNIMNKIKKNLSSNDIEINPKNIRVPLYLKTILGKRVEERKKSSNYEKIKKYLSNPTEEITFDWKHLENNLHHANISVDINHTSPISSGRNKAIRWLALRIRQIIQAEIRFTLDPIIHNQKLYNSYTTNTLNQIHSLLKHLDKITRENIEKLQHNEQKISTHLEKITGLGKELSTQKSEITGLGNEILNHKDRISDINNKVDSHKSEITGLETEVTNHNLDLLKLTETVFPNLNWRYLEFENRFRGSEEEIRDRQLNYLQFIKNALRNTKGEFVLEVGCGRGEFLKILKENKIPVKGIDTNPTMVQFNVERNRPAELIDANSLLNSTSDNSLVGITAFQVIEHYPPEYLIKFVQLSYQKIAKGGVIILETVNPMSLFSLTHFWYDITHKKPIPPDIIKFYLEIAGFDDVSIIFSGNVPNELQLAGNDENIKKLNQILFGPQDYAIIAWKKQ